MKKRIIALPCVALFAAAIAGAQTVPNKVGVIQLQAAMVNTKDGQRALADLETRMAPKKKDLDRKRSEIQELQDKLNKSGNVMPQAAKDDLARNIDIKTKAFNRDMEDAQAELEQEQRKIYEEIGGKLQTVVDKYAQTNGYAVILDVSNPNSGVFYISTSADITKDIIELYDKSSPTAPSSKPAAPATPKPTTSTPTTTPAKPATTTPPPTAPVKKP